MLDYYRLKEKIKYSTIYASLFALIGIIISVLDAENVTNAPQGEDPIVGLICGLITSSCLGLNFVLLRSKPNIPAIGATGFGGIFSGLIGFCFVQQEAQYTI